MRAMRYFVAIARSGSLRAASEVLNISQPALGMQLRQLEDRLGITLFDRHSRGVTLTRAGAVFLEEAEQVLVAYARAEASIAIFRRPVTEVLRIGVSSTVARLLIPELIAEKSDSSGIEIKVRVGYDAELRGNILTDELDVALFDSHLPLNLPNARILATEDLWLIGPPSRVDPELGPIKLQALQSIPIVMDSIRAPDRAFAEYLATTHDIRFDLVAEVEPISSRRQLMLEHEMCCISTYPTFLNELGDGRLTARPIDAEGASLRLYLLTRAGLNPQVLEPFEALIEKAIRRLVTSNQAPWNVL